jgi:hypothetical protein
MACNLTIRALTCYRATNCASKNARGEDDNAQFGPGHRVRPPFGFGADRLKSREVIGIESTILLFPRR